MKIKFLPFVFAICASVLMFTSCLKGDEVSEIEYSSATSITSFSLGTLKIAKVGKDKKGNDSAYVDTINCSKYVFSINQLARTIENKDSLPMGVDISKVIAKITGDTRAITYRVKTSSGSTKDTLYTSTDSIDFTTPQSIKVYTVNGIAGKPYTVKVNVHAQDPDLMVWKTFDLSSGITPVKAVTSGERLYLVGTSNGTAVAKVLSIAQGTPSAWESIALPAGTNPYSLTQWQNACYFIAAGKLYRFTELGYEAVTVSGMPRLLQLLGGASGTVPVLYAQSEAGTGSISNAAWTIDANAQALSGITATTAVMSHGKTLAYNTSLSRVLMVYPQATTDSVAVVAQRLSSETDWNTYVAGTSSLLNLEKLQLHYYNGKYMAFGGAEISGKTGVAAFAKIYVSADNGLRWLVADSKLAFPADGSFATYYTASSRNFASAVDDNHYLWIVWGNGKVSRGRINKLGFSSAW